MKDLILFSVLVLSVWFSSYCVRNPFIEKYQGKVFINNALVKNAFYFLGLIDGILLMKLMEHFLIFLTPHH